MPDTHIILYVLAEALLVLLVVTLFLIVHVRKIKALVKRLEQKISEQRDELAQSAQVAKATQEALQQQKHGQKGYLDYLDQELDATLDYHQSLSEGSDIAFDISRDAPIERQVCSLRYSFLVAEKDARYAGIDDQSSWDVLQDKFNAIMQIYDPPKAPETNAESDTDNSDSLAARVTLLEQENASLQTLLDLAEQPSEEEGGGLKDRVNELQQELLNAQTRYIELEERYEELKSR